MLIKVSKYIYIHWLTLALFASAYITRTLEITAIMYLVMLLHELSHAAAAYYLKLGISRIILYPFGVSLLVGTRLLCSLSDGLILYLSGPLVNAVIAAIMAILGIKNLFFINNLVIFLLNLLPILPLDGGRIAECILLRRYSDKSCRIIMSVLSAVIAAAICLILILGKAVNINTLSFIAFIVGGCIMQKPKYNRDLVRELALCKSKKGLKSNVIIADKSIPERKIISEFSPSKSTLVVFCNESGGIERLKTDKEVIFDILG